jgi:hypothetical protein
VFPCPCQCKPEAPVKVRNTGVPMGPVRVPLDPHSCSYGSCQGKAHSFCSRHTNSRHTCSLALCIYLFFSLHSICYRLLTFVRGPSIGCAGAGLGGGRSGLPMLELSLLPLLAPLFPLPFPFLPFALLLFLSLLLFLLLFLLPFRVLELGRGRGRGRGRNVFSLSGRGLLSLYHARCPHAPSFRLPTNTQMAFERLLDTPALVFCGCMSCPDGKT